MEHHAPHDSAAFEGYYNKFALPSGGHLVIVITKIKDASRPNALSVVYCTKDGSVLYQKDSFPAETVFRRLRGESDAFTVEVAGIGRVTWNSDDTTEYKLETEDIKFDARTTSRTPWSDASNTPEGILVRLPLPLHWHVQTLASSCQFNLKFHNLQIPNEHISGDAIVHQEKNWAFSFPSAHMWIQCRDGNRGLCCAGGQILGMEAFLLGYRSEGLSFDFRPPFALKIGGVSPFMSHNPDWEKRTFELSLQSFRRKITVKAVAPKKTFFPLVAPFSDGFRENYLNQSFQARIEVKIYESGWFGSWRLVREDVFESGGLEFGAGYYPCAGTDQQFN